MRESRMKPMFRTVTVPDKIQELAETTVDNGDSGGNSGFPLPPEMQSRPDAAEIRQFLSNYQKIPDPEGRRMIMNAVLQAIEEDT